MGKSFYLIFVLFFTASCNSAPIHNDREISECDESKIDAWRNATDGNIEYYVVLDSPAGPKYSEVFSSYKEIMNIQVNLICRDFFEPSSFSNCYVPVMNQIYRLKYGGAIVDSFVRMVDSSILQSILKDTMEKHDLDNPRLQFNSSSGRAVYLKDSIYSIIKQCVNPEELNNMNILFDLLIDKRGKAFVSDFHLVNANGSRYSPELGMECLNKKLTRLDFIPGRVIGRPVNCIYHVQIE